MTAAVALERIPVAGPWITDLEVSYVADAAATNWYANAGDYLRRFEEAFAHRVGRQHAVALPSCTSALHLALLALGVGPGDEVVVPDVTWIASSAPIAYVGATAVFADVDADTWCLRPDALRACLTERTRAVIVVDLYGGMPAMEAVLTLAAGHGVAVVEDAAEAVGSAYRGRPAGSFGVASTFSFHGSKTLTTGEGGMLVTDDDRLWERVLVLRDHGRPPGDTAFSNTEVAHKYRMSAVQAALGLAQLERLEELVSRKRQIFCWYCERLRGLDGVALNAEPPGTVNSFWMATAVLDPDRGVDKGALQRALAERGIDSRPFFHPLSSLPAYAAQPEARRAAARNQVSYRLSPYGLNLPSALTLTEQHVERVCTAFAKALGGA